MIQWPDDSILLTQSSILSWRADPRAQVPGNPLLRMYDDEHSWFGPQPGEPSLHVILVHIFLDNLPRRPPNVALDDLRSPFDDHRLEPGRVVNAERHT